VCVTLPENVYSNLFDTPCHWYAHSSWFVLCVWLFVGECVNKEVYVSTYIHTWFFFLFVYCTCLFYFYFVALLVHFWFT